MRKYVLFVLLATVFFFATPARAQQPKYVVSFNVGIQVGDNSLERTDTFDLYEETATVDISQTINNGAFIDFGGAVRVSGNFGVGFSYGFVTNSGDGTASGSLPHPLFFDQPRTFTTSVDDLKHSEQSFHFHAVYFIPFTEKVDFTVSGGPSIFTVKQGLIRSVIFSEIPPTFSSVTIDSVDIVEVKNTGWGFNIGADMTYLLTPRIGVAALIRYTHGGVDLEMSESQVAEITAGGFQLGGGVRYRF
jgi:hypothetical protein